MKKVHPKVDEAIQTLNMKDGPSRRKLLTGTGLVSATAAASALLAACSSSSSASSSSGGSTASAAAGAIGNFPKTPPWQFWFVNHVTTNLFFVPTQFGFSDAAALLGLPKPKWGGSQNSIPSEMVTYLQTAISAKAAGIATCGHQQQAVRHHVRHPGDERDERRAPGGQLQRGRPDPQRRGDAGHEPALLRRAGALPVRPADGRADQVPGQAGRDRHLHRHPGLGQHPAALRRRRLGPHLGRLPGQDGGDRRDDRP